MACPEVKDRRSEKIIFLSHCCLNQNAKVRGIARCPGVIRPLVELIIERGIGIYQMPCPEMMYLGNMRWGLVKDQYNNPMFRKHCRRLADEVVDQAENYRQCSYRILGFVMVDGSPVCGLNRVPLPKNRDEPWGGMIRYIPECEYVPEKGVFCEILQEELNRRGLDDIPFAAAPEFDEVGLMEDALKQIEALVE